MADGGGDTPTEGQLGPPDLIPHIIPVDLGKFSISILGYMPGLAKKIQPEKKLEKNYFNPGVFFSLVFWGSNHNTQCTIT